MRVENNWSISITTNFETKSWSSSHHLLDDMSQFAEFDSPSFDIEKNFYQILVSVLIASYKSGEYSGEFCAGDFFFDYYDESDINSLFDNLYEYIPNLARNSMKRPLSLADLNSSPIWKALGFISSEVIKILNVEFDYHYYMTYDSRFINFIIDFQLQKVFDNVFKWLENDMRNLIDWDSRRIKTLYNQDDQCYPNEQIEYLLDALNDNSILFGSNRNLKIADIIYSIFGKCFYDEELTEPISNEDLDLISKTVESEVNLFPILENKKFTTAGLVDKNTNKYKKLISDLNCEYLSEITDEIEFILVGPKAGKKLEIAMQKGIMTYYWNNYSKEFF